MPAIDSCEPNVINALKKQGWEVADKPYRIMLAEGDYLYADFTAIRTGDKEQQEIIIVEVKCFPDSSTKLDEYYRALGQYSVYHGALADENLEKFLYLAVPADVYDMLFGRNVIQRSLQMMKVRFIVINMDTEEIVQWTT